MAFDDGCSKKGSRSFQGEIIAEQWHLKPIKLSLASREKQNQLQPNSIQSIFEWWEFKVSSNEGPSPFSKRK